MSADSDSGSASARESHADRDGRAKTGSRSNGGRSHAGRSDAASASSEPETTLRTRRETGHWTGIAALSLVAGGVGVIVSVPALLLVSVLGVGYVVYAHVGAPSGAGLTIEREFSEPSPEIGDEVRIRTTVRNDGGFLPDVRVVDGVPPELPVVSGSPRIATAMAPGGEFTLEYDVVARRGTHEFEPATALVRGVNGAVEREYALDDRDAIVCEPALETASSIPIRSLLTRYTGRVDTDVGGAGLEFHSTREYRHGDPPGRIDWNRRARTGEFTTLEFREERSVTVVLLVDLREEAYVRADETGLHAVDHGVDAASRVFAALLETGDRVGVAGLSPEDVWLPPGLGNDHRARARRLFAKHPALSPVAPDEPYYTLREVRTLRKRLPRDAQLVVFSPLCDDSVVETIRRLEAHGHPATVVSPDPTGSETLGQRVGRAERDVRITRLREAGVPVIDWDTDDSFAATVADARRRSR